MGDYTNHSSSQYYHLMHKFCNNQTDLDRYINNLTSSYADKSNEVPMVAASVIMFFLAGLFSIFNLFSRFSNVSAILNPKVRVFLTSALSLFLPVMSYLFSEAKNSTGQNAVDYVHKPELSLQADVILVWMLLVELLRKKVDEIVMRGYSSTIQRAGRVVWLGTLVFFNIQSPGRKALFGILWILCAAKVVQRIIFTEVGKRSYAYGKNPRVITSYVSQRLQGTSEALEQGGGAGGHNKRMIEESQLIVRGEEELIEEATADGYKLKDDMPPTVVTVGRIWRQLDNAIDPDERFKRLCLSFALFKLLRRRFEHLSQVVTKEETQECRAIIFDGIYSSANQRENAADAVFQMINTEVNFLSEYYHSVIPVVFASPFFFRANYLMFPVVVLGLCLMTVVLCGNGDGRYAFSVMKTDNFAISSGVIDITVCLILKSFKSPTAFFTTVDFLVTFLLFAIFLYEEIWEFVVFLFSSWFKVSLLCSYVVTSSRPDSCRRSTCITRNVLRMQNKMSKPTLTFKQFYVLNVRWPLMLGMPSTLSSLMLSTAPVPKKAKDSIMDYLVSHIRAGSQPLSNGRSVLLAAGHHHLLRACDSRSVAEVILTWHIATSLFDEACPPNTDNTRDFGKVATRLSKYCAYLVAIHPELLPGNQDKTEKVFEAFKEELKGMLGCYKYFFSLWRTRLSMLNQNRDTDQEWKEDQKVVHNGVKLGKLLRDLNSLPETWKLLANFWTELIIYVAPSDNEEERIVGHENVLVEGGEFITTLWALTTHTGISRQGENPIACC